MARSEHNPDSAEQYYWEATYTDEDGEVVDVRGLEAPNREVAQDELDKIERGEHPDFAWDNRPNGTRHQLHRCYEVETEFSVQGFESRTGEAKEFGGSAHVTVPKDWRGADVKVIRTSEPEDTEE